VKTTTSQFAQSTLRITLTALRTLFALTVTFLSMTREVFSKLRGANPIVRTCVGVGVIVMALYTLSVVNSNVMSAVEIAAVLTVEALLVIGVVVGAVKLPAVAARFEGSLSLDDVSFSRSR
jgi:hypothetical protein